MPSRFWVGGSGTWNAVSTTNWSTTSGGSAGASVPVSVDDAIFDANSGAGVVVIEAGYNPVLLRLIAVNYTGTLDFGSQSVTLTGNGSTILSAGTAATYLGSKQIISSYSGATGSRTFTTLNMSEANALNLKITAGTDIIATSNGSTLSNLDFTGFSGSFNIVGVTLFGNLALSSTMTTTSGTNAFVFASTSGVKTITTAGITVNRPMTFNGVGGAWEFQDALTQLSTRAFTITNGTVLFKNGVTSTVGVFSTSGTAQKFIGSTVAGSQATLTQAGGRVNASYLTIKDIKATGGATWDAFTNRRNIDGGNNDGWNFLSIPFPVFGGIFRLIFKPVIQ
jgi:hypothetical protein